MYTHVVICMSSPYYVYVHIVCACVFVRVCVRACVCLTQRYVCVFVCVCMYMFNCTNDASRVVLPLSCLSGHAVRAPWRGSAIWKTYADGRMLTYADGRMLTDADGCCRMQARGARALAWLCYLEDVPRIFFEGGALPGSKSR